MWLYKVFGKIERLIGIWFLNDEKKNTFLIK